MLIILNDALYGIFIHLLIALLGIKRRWIPLLDRICNVSWELKNWTREPKRKKSTKRKTDEHKNAKTKQPDGYMQKQRNARNEPSSYPSVTASVYLRQGRWCCKILTIKQRPGKNTDRWRLVVPHNTGIAGWLGALDYNNVNPTYSLNSNPLTQRDPD